MARVFVCRFGAESAAGLKQPFQSQCCYGVGVGVAAPERCTAVEGSMQAGDLSFRLGPLDGGQPVPRGFQLL
jgi:hypothetical protein